MYGATAVVSGFRSLDNSPRRVGMLPHFESLQPARPAYVLLDTQTAVCLSPLTEQAAPLNGRVLHCRRSTRGIGGIRRKGWHGRP
jgi:hypothetical protein